MCSLSERIFENLLFPSLGYQHGGGALVERLPCLHGPTRAEIYNLLLHLVNDFEPCTQMVMLNKRLFPRGMLPVNLDYKNLYRADEPLHDNHIADRSRWARSSAGHVGLQNMSNTCYLNSLLAQLFMNRSFRSFVLGMDVSQTDESQKLLYSMKVLFAKMQNSYSKAVEPKDFVEAITDYEGEPIDISIQMDVDEFYNLVFDRLEGQMSSLEMKSSFRGYYGGQLVQQVKSTECEHISERNEPFSAIQCDIKGKTNLQESLKAYVGGEVMDGGKSSPFM
jgi:ubiquitin carboxyl-terminal hydrolase 34